MAEKYTSRIALTLSSPVDDVGHVLSAATAAGDVDRHAPVGDGRVAREVNWGGRMAKAVIRSMEDDEDSTPLLRSEAYIGGEGLVQGMARQAQLLQGLSRHLPDNVTGVRDLSALVDRDLAWLNRVAIGAVEPSDAITLHDAGEGIHWVYTHGAARFDVPDLELYGLVRAQLPAAREAIRHIHGQLLSGGLKADLSLPSGRPVYLVPVIEAWQSLPLEWSGIGRAGQDRGPGLDGPRATLSILHPPRLGRYKKDFKGVLEELSATDS